MARELAFRIVLYLLDGAFWVCSCSWILTKFYGYQAKPSKSRKMIFAAAILIYDILNVLIYYVSVKNGSTIGVIYGFIALFVLGYWMVYLRESGKIKKLLIIYFAIELCSSVLNLIACVCSTFIWITYDSIVASVVRFYMQISVTMGVIWLVSWYSSRKRKEPMRFSLVVSTYIMCILLDMVLDFFHVEGYTELQPIIKFRQLLAEGNMDETMSRGVLLIVFIVVFLFLDMIIRESEAYYFQKKNAVSEYYLEIQKRHYESLMESNREIRRMKHDMRNHIYCLKELYHKKRYGELGEYLNGLGDNLGHADTSVHVGNEIADAIISEKMTKAEKLGIVLKVDGDMSGVKMSALDVCTIFANMIDNALEAVETLSGDDRKITLDIRKNHNFLLISERNMVGHKVEIHDNMIATTKRHKENHGFGIINMKETVCKYDGELEIEVVEGENNHYVFQIEIVIPISV